MQAEHEKYERLGLQFRGAPLLLQYEKRYASATLAPVRRGAFCG